MRHTLLILLLSCLSLTAQALDQVVDVPLSLAPFQHLNAAGNSMSIVITTTPTTKKTAPTCTLSIEKRLKPYVTIKASDTQKNTLVVDFKLHDFKRTIVPRLACHVQHLSSMTLGGAMGAYMGEIKQDSLRLELSGAARFRGAGNLQSLTLKNSGAAHYRGEDIVVQQATIHASGASRTFVHATQKLTADISGAGRVYYKGSPKIQQKISGFGRLEAMQTRP